MKSVKVIMLIFSVGTCSAIESSLNAAEVMEPKIPISEPSKPEMSVLTRDQLPFLTKEELIQEINKTKEIMEDAMFKAFATSHDKKIAVIGDTHGNSHELIATINKMRKDGCFKKEDPWVLQDNYYLIFTGDIADRGPDSLGTWQIVIKLIQNNPTHCILLRGNHETLEMATGGDYANLYEQIKNKYSEGADKVLNTFVELFNKLPNLLFLGLRQPDGTFLFGMYCHGGPDPRISPDSIKNLITESVILPGTFINKTLTDMTIVKIDEHEFEPVGDNGLLWSDFEYRTPQVHIKWNKDRGSGYKIDPVGVRQILQSYSSPNATVSYIVRAHQHMRTAINRLIPTQTKLNIPGGWDRLNAPLLIQPDSVFTFMCLGPSIFERFPDPATQAGYGLIEMNQENQLTITPRIAIDFAEK